MKYKHCFKSLFSRNLNYTLFWLEYLRLPLPCKPILQARHVKDSSMVILKYEKTYLFKRKSKNINLFQIRWSVLYSIPSIVLISWISMNPNNTKRRKRMIMQCYWAVSDWFLRHAVFHLQNFHPGHSSLSLRPLFQKKLETLTTYQRLGKGKGVREWEWVSVGFATATTCCI